MKIYFFAVLGLSLFGSGPTGVVSKELEVSDFQRKLAVTYEGGCDATTGEQYRCCNVGRWTCMPGDSTDLVVSGGSCNGENACRSTGSLDVGFLSCIGDSACRGAGEDLLNVNLDTTIIGSNSCKGNRACESLARDGVAIVGSNSCNGDFNGAKNVPCQFAAADGGNLWIGDNSCNGQYSCKAAGKYGRSATIGNDSCNERKACFQAGLDADEDENSDKEVTVGDNSCNGNEACRLRNRSAVVGSGSCNCPFCCSCLPDGAIVPDNKCNSFGDDECCIDKHRRNPNFDFSTDAESDMCS